MALPFVFVDLLTTDVDAAREFYSAMFGWSVAELPFGDKTVPMLVDSDGPWGGLTALTGADQRRPQWLPYVPVPDVAKAVGQATALGATVVRERAEVPIAAFAVIADPTGALLVLWEPRRN
jgi:predicted enzyme related to lactoylglutathione lyase